MKEQSKHPLVSVVMCTYNAERYIAEAVESILGQTYSNFEFIIWDDGSTDGTKSIIDSYKDERIQYIYHENTGLGMALRLACAQATGKYIARMDSDDVCLTQRFMREVEFLEENKDYVLVSSAVRYIDEEGNLLGRTFPCTKDSLLKEALRHTNMIVHPMVMMRRDAYIRAGGYVGIKAFEDRVFWSRLAKYGSFANLTEVLGYYRIQSNSISHVVNPYSQVLQAFQLKMIEDEQVSDCDIDMYNKIYITSKRVQRKNEYASTMYRKSVEDSLFGLMGKGRLAERIICSLKNLYWSLRYCTF